MKTQFNTKLVGANFRPTHVKAMISELEFGDEVTLSREPDNEYDDQAVQVWAGGEFIGYIPKSDNRTIAQLLDIGGEATGTVTDRESPLKLLLNIEIEYDEEAAADIEQLPADHQIPPDTDNREGLDKTVGGNPPYGTTGNHPNPNVQGVSDPDNSNPDRGLKQQPDFDPESGTVTGDRKDPEVGNGPEGSQY